MTEFDQIDPNDHHQFDNTRNLNAPFIPAEDDDSDGYEEGFQVTDFSSLKVRQVFIRKVFSLLSIMLGITALFVTYLALSFSA